MLALALAAPAAFAQSSQDGYIQEGPSIVDQTTGDSGDDAAAAQSSDGGNDELPFTGLDLGLLGVAGASMLLLGVGMRRLTRAQDRA